MAKLPFMQFYPADYLLDTQPLSASTRGIWMDMICWLWRAEPRGVLEKSTPEWLKILRVTPSEFTRACKELDMYHICAVLASDRNGNGAVMIMSRRMVREEKHRSNNRLYVQRHRRKIACKTEDTNGKTENQKSESEVRYQISESEREEKKKITAGQRPRLTAKSAATWEAYRAAYHSRYGVDPVRNHKTNSLLCQVVDKLGLDEGPKVAAFYLTRTKPLYVSSKHAPDLLSRDAEGLRTEWATGVRDIGEQPKSMVEIL